VFANDLISYKFQLHGQAAGETQQQTKAEEGGFTPVIAKKITGIIRLMKADDKDERAVIRRGLRKENSMTAVITTANRAERMLMIL